MSGQVRIIKATERQLTITETVARRFKSGGRTIFTLASGLIIGKSKAGGTVEPYAISAVEVALAIVAHVEPDELRKVKRAVDERWEEVRL